MPVSHAERQRSYRQRKRDQVRDLQATIDREKAMRAMPYDVTDCDGCHLVERIPQGELIPDAWRRTLRGELLCARCYERHLLTIKFRNQYPL